MIARSEWPAWVSATVLCAIYLFALGLTVWGVKQWIG
jgi:hypothetical protein